MDRPRSPQSPAVRCAERQDPAICGVLFCGCPLACWIHLGGEGGGGGGIEQMTLRLMLCAFILLALGGCQNPSRIQAASSHSAAMD
jgi:hypothetical protein